LRGNELDGLCVAALLCVCFFIVVVDQQNNQYWQDEFQSFNTQPGGAAAAPPVFAIAEMADGPHRSSPDDQAGTAGGRGGSGGGASDSSLDYSPASAIKKGGKAKKGKVCHANWPLAMVLVQSGNGLVTFMPVCRGGGSWCGGGGGGEMWG
jgi:hypothetical protein